jgi:hypothetical protein
MNEEELKVYVSFMQSLHKEVLTKERLELFRLINGELFYPMREWPTSYKTMFWKKPHSDKSTFQILLFLLGNGCPPEIAQKWILSSMYWSTWGNAHKRGHQLLWLTKNIENPQYDKKWFYYDLHNRLYVYMNGHKK